MSTVRVLLLTCHLPYPPISGGRLREFELVKRLGAAYDLRLVVVTKTIEEDIRNCAVLEAYCSAVDIFEAKPQTTEFESGLAPQERRQASAEATAHVRTLVQSGNIDLVHVEGFYLMQHIPRDTAVPVLLVEQNIEAALFEQRLRRAATRSEKRALANDGELTWRGERYAWARSDVIGAVTQEDLATVRKFVTDRPLVILPDGVDHLINPPPACTDGLVSELPRAPSLAFIANFSYAPNIDAAIYFCEDILPRIRRRSNDVTAWLVGNDPPDEIRALSCDKIVVTGRVRSVVPYLQAADIVVCPLRIGGGIKVKILEAAWAGKAIVTTSVGAQGFPNNGRGAFCVEDNPRRFADRVTRLLERDDEREVLGAAAAKLASSLATWDDAARAVAQCYEDLIPLRAKKLITENASDADPGATTRLASA